MLREPELSALRMKLKEGEKSNEQSRMSIFQQKSLNRYLKCITEN